MKIQIFSLSLFLISLGTTAQKVYSTLEIQGSKTVPSHYFFIHGSDKKLSGILEDYFDRNFKVDQKKVTTNLYSEQLSNFASTLTFHKVEENDDEHKLIFVFKDEKNRPLENSELPLDSIHFFLRSMALEIKEAMDAEMFVNDKAAFEKKVSNAEREVNNLKKSIEKNLNDQEKLGKRIDQTPEDLEKLIDEKNALLQKELDGEEELEKALTKKEKEVLKRKKKESKDEKKLAQRERQLEELVNEYAAARMLLSSLKEVLSSKKGVINPF